jgi:pyruvate dehydrogenase (quinone)
VNNARWMKPLDDFRSSVRIPAADALKRAPMTRFNNEDLNEVTWEQRVMEGSARCAATQDMPNFAYARFGEMLRLRGIYVDHRRRSPPHGEKPWLVIGRSFSKSRSIRTSQHFPRILRSRKRGDICRLIAKGDTATVGVISETARQVFYGILGRSDPK